MAECTSLLELQRFIDPCRNEAVSWDMKLLPTLAIWAAFTPNDYTIVVLFDNSWSMGPAHCGFVQHTISNNSLYATAGFKDIEEEIGHDTIMTCKIKDFFFQCRVIVNLYLTRRASLRLAFFFFHLCPAQDMPHFFIKSNSKRDNTQPTNKCIHPASAAPLKAPSPPQQLMHYLISSWFLNNFLWHLNYFNLL